MKPLKNIWAPVLVLLILAGCNSDQGVLESLDTYDNDSQKDPLWANLEPGDPIPGQYIVVFSDEMDLSRLTHTRALNRQAQMTKIVNDFIDQKGLSQREIPFAYHSSIRGFASHLEADEKAILEQDPKVSYIEQDIVVGLAGKPEKPGNGNNNGGGGNGGGGNPPPPPQVKPWNIERVNGGVTYTGNAVAWIIDSGLDMDNPDLNIDGSRGFTAFHNSNSKKFLQDEGNHGTPVAGIIGAIDNDIGIVGVAAGVTVIPVKVLDGIQGSASSVVAGVDWVVANGSAGDIANMSIGSAWPSPAIDNAVSAAAGSGIIFTIAGGNHQQHADSSSPGRVNGPNIFTISNMDSTDTYWHTSNYGNPPIDYCAPGAWSVTLHNDGAVGYFGGTSASAPHAAGVLLLGPPQTDGYVIGDPDGNPDPIIVH